MLISSTGSLTLVKDPGGVGNWCQVHLLVPGADRPLGAEGLEYITTRLGSFLADTTPGQRWVFSLSELHTSAYGEHLSGKTLVRLQDADGRMFATLELTPAERQQWLQTLRRQSGE